MQISVQPGRYVVAVSGGVDSMVLLQLLSQQPSLELIVAHFEHGIRPESDQDRLLVQAAAQRLGLPFYYEHGQLGAQASEALAREARYRFLTKIKRQTGAQALITAHHQDDLMETIIINLLRGTGRKGLSSLASTEQIVRPLLAWTKHDVYQQAAELKRRNPHFTWSEDSTNEDDQYLRNYVRHHIITQLGEAGRRSLLDHARKAGQTNPLIDALLLRSMDNHRQSAVLDRRWFTMLPYDISCEVMAAWLRQNGIRQFDRKLIERLVVTAKVAIPGKVADITAGFLLKTSKTDLQITPTVPSSKQFNSV